ncbi:hypothetical protein [Streptomyces sp. NPDC059080]|uniref:hypothetical protein n=1 Tax=Streptomyces sp. NPDC059080 TaxID=3346718 RepID=UPI0036C146BC
MRRGNQREGSWTTACTVPLSLWRPEVASAPLHAGAAEAELTVWEQLIVGGLARKA